MKVYNRYINSKDCTWYDSSNVYYSECQDSQEDVKQLKVIFKQGHTYIYKDVALTDYFMFRNAESTGSAFHKYIKKYEFARMPDTSIDELETLKQQYMEEENIAAQETNDVNYTIELNTVTNDLRLKRGDIEIFNGVEGEISAISLLRSMAINFKLIEKNDGQE